MTHPEAVERGVVLEELIPDYAVFFGVGIRVLKGTGIERTAVGEGRISPGHNLLDPTYHLAPVQARTPGICTARVTLGGRRSPL